MVLLLLLQSTLGYGGVVVVAEYRQKTNYLGILRTTFGQWLDVWVPLYYRLWCCCCRVPSNSVL